MASEPLIRKLVTQFLAVYPLQRSDTAESQALLRLAWLEVLGDDEIPDHLLALAAKQWLAEPHEFRPAPGQLRAKILELTMPAEIREPEATAIAAWGRMLQVDWREEIEPLAAECLQHIGLGRYDLRQNLTVENMVAHRAAFVRCYAARLRAIKERRNLLPEVRREVEIAPPWAGAIQESLQLLAGRLRKVIDVDEGTDRRDSEQGDERGPQA